MLRNLFLPTPPSLLAAPGEPFLHRDLSWLQFNERVLAEAREHTNPLLERLKFLSITASNLDEFFMIRFASLGRTVRLLTRQDPAVAESHARVRDDILERVGSFATRQAETLDLLSTELEYEGISIQRNTKPGDEAFEAGKEIFATQILPSLTPPEPWNRTSLESIENLGLRAFFPSDLWFRVPKGIPGAYVSRPAADGKLFVFLLDDLLLTHLGDAFRLVGTPGILRVTRDGDFTVDLEEEDPESIPELIRTGIGSRDKGRVVRIQHVGELPEDLFRKALLAYRMLQPQFFQAPGTLHLQSLWSIVSQIPEPIRTRPTLTYPMLVGAVTTSFQKEALEKEDLFEKVRRHDYLFHHPYDSFDAFVHWIENACKDPDVIRIEQTVYRMDAFSPVIDALKAAATKKKIQVIIELRARFDELNNLRLADDLRRAGVEVAFGFGSLKLHAKIALVTRKEKTPDGTEKLVHYTHLSTGNYNATTARQYEDLAILTAHPEFGEDARLFFDAIWNRQVPDATAAAALGAPAPAPTIEAITAPSPLKEPFKVPSRFKQLVPAPTRLYNKLVKLIQEETEAAKKGSKARIFAKVNALVDHRLIEHLYVAAQAGVKIDLVVRGACSLIPGVQGLSTNIRVLSIVDRFLEHSRIYYFGSSGALYLSSADWMQRNLLSRLELAFPVLDPTLHRTFTEILIPCMLEDTVRARELTAQGAWKKKQARPHKLAGGKPMRCQFFFSEVPTEKLVERLV